ncbi:MAG: hypothetical protein WBQ60_10590 [Asticcacaulis sp.]
MIPANWNFQRSRLTTQMAIEYIIIAIIAATVVIPLIALIIQGRKNKRR